jgi:hypothetical protein
VLLGTIQGEIDYGNDTRNLLEYRQGFEHPDSHVPTDLFRTDQLPKRFAGMDIAEVPVERLEA